jgi:general transcription factor 3C polypeptide 5 (transcription factor C subunit 1)
MNKIPDENTRDKRVKRAIDILRAELIKRPLLARRVQAAVTQEESEQVLRRTWPYTGYMFRTGPFKNLLIRFGVDPRADPKYRIYQGLTFQLPETRIGNKKRYGQPSDEKPPKTYDFDGFGAYLDARVWQLCDISDPILSRWIQDAQVNDECEPSVIGWYGTGTLAILRTIIKDKLVRFTQGELPDNDLYEEVKSHWRDHVTENNIDLTYPAQPVEPDVGALLTIARSKAIIMAKEIGVDRQRKGLQTTMDSGVNLLDVSDSSEDSDDLDLDMGDDDGDGDEEDDNDEE